MALLLFAVTRDVDVVDSSCSFLSWLFVSGFPVLNLEP